MTSGMQLWAAVLSTFLLLPGCPASGDGEYQSCVAQCQGRECGDDGCGGTCGQCSGATVCGSDGKCSAEMDAATKPEVEVSQFEIVIPDGSVEKICQSLYVQFQGVLVAGSTCEKVLDCRVTIAAGDPCHCALFASDVAATGHLAALEAEYVDRSCAAREMCDPCPWAEVPVCNHGVCAPTQPSCPEVEGQYYQALLLAQQCTSDEQCTGRVAGSLDCDCEVPVNGTAWTGYFGLAHEFWKSSDCGVQLDCSCVELGEVGCLEGVCGVVE